MINRTMPLHFQNSIRLVWKFNVCSASEINDQRPVKILDQVDGFKRSLNKPYL